MEKRFSIAQQVVDEFSTWCMNFQNQEINKMPVLWYKTIETFAKFYGKFLNDNQRQAFTFLLKKKFKHEYFTSEILKWVNQREK